MIVRRIKVAEENTYDERREKERVPCSEPSFISMDGSLCEVEIKDIGGLGVFIKSEMEVSVGQTVTIAVPYSENGMTKHRGKIAWKKPGGFGVQFCFNENDNPEKS